MCLFTPCAQVLRITLDSIDYATKCTLKGCTSAIRNQSDLDRAVCLSLRNQNAQEKVMNESQNAWIAIAKASSELSYGVHDGYDDGTATTHSTPDGPSLPAKLEI